MYTIYVDREAYGRSFLDKARYAAAFLCLHVRTANEAEAGEPEILFADRLNYVRVAGSVPGEVGFQLTANNFADAAVLSHFLSV